MFKHIFLPTDGSELAERAVRAGIVLARESGAKVTAFTAVPEYPLPSEAEAMAHKLVSLEEHERASARLARKTLERAAEEARAAGIAYEEAFLQCNRPWEAIVKAAGEHGCDLIVMASHGRRGLKKLLLGSETQAVLSHSAIPTLVYR
jgi:nucleotide-binding universal stress UspA family protein